ncbi:hypothetical protein GCM10009844_39000 [Nocardioides koreensis]|uniref:Uncharacterized protein n=1 Tax=Nocardioides koreensis TaxID=433651 RepID=A0ABP5LTZ3_9ACTN
MHEFVTPGNALLESLFAAANKTSESRDGRSVGSYPDLQCLYWPVVPHRGDHITETDSLLRMCYRSAPPAARPYAITGMAVSFD